MQGKRLLEPNDYAARIRVGTGNLQIVNKRDDVFSISSGTARTKIGRGMHHLFAEGLSYSDWTSFESVITCSKSDESGFHPLAGECYWAIGSNNKKYFIIDTIDEHGPIEEVKKITTSIRFTV